VRNSSVALLSVGQVQKNSPPHVQHMYWAATASKHAYDAARGLPFYVMAQAVTTRQAAWDKLVAIKAVMAHSGADWVWCTDSDALVMNVTIDIEAFARDVQASKPTASVIITKDCNGINTGSWLMRNTAWPERHVTEAWFLNDTSVVSIRTIHFALLFTLHNSNNLLRRCVLHECSLKLLCCSNVTGRLKLFSSHFGPVVPGAWCLTPCLCEMQTHMPEGWWEQSAFMYLLQRPEVASRYHIVQQRDINAYPSDLKCYDSSGPYQVRRCTTCHTCPNAWPPCCLSLLL
jgi:hypothetical protein